MDRDDLYPCRDDEGKHPGDQKLIAQSWTSIAPAYLKTYLANPERTVTSAVRESRLGSLLINNRPVHPDMLRYVQTYWATRPHPSHMHIHRAVHEDRAKQTRMHSAYRAKRGGHR